MTHNGPQKTQTRINRLLLLPHTRMPELLPLLLGYFLPPAPYSQCLGSIPGVALLVTPLPVTCSRSNVRLPFNLRVQMCARFHSWPSPCASQHNVIYTDGGGAAGVGRGACCLQALDDINTGKNPPKKISTALSFDLRMKLR